MYSEEEKDMIFLVVDRKEVHAVQRKVQEIDPKAFFVVTDAYDTYGEASSPSRKRVQFRHSNFQKYRGNGNHDRRFPFFGPNFTGWFRTVNMNDEKKINTLRPLQGAGRKLFVETYGCQMNVGDTEIVVAIMQQEGYVYTDKIEERMSF